jgi:hypothetical protein
LTIALVVSGVTQAQRVIGTSAADVLRGTARSDHIYGRGGNDQILGFGGGDVLVGGTGKDRISAGAGADDVRAVDGEKDRIACGAGPDRVNADPIDRVAADCELVNPQRLTVTVDGQGVVRSTPKRIGCPSACSKLFSQHTIVKLTAEAAIDYNFIGWHGACSGTGTCKIRLDSPKSVTATFQPVQ